MQADDTERGLCHVPIGPRRQDQRRPNLAEYIRSISDVRGYLWQGISLQPVIIVSFRPAIKRLDAKVRFQ